MARISFHHFSKMFGAAALVVCLAGLASFWASHQAAHAQDQSNNSVVGVWEVKVVGAPFQPHLFTFHSDGTFLSANPDAGDTNTSDSDGEGTWQTDQQGNGNTVTGIFKEYDASRGPPPAGTPPAGTFTGTLTVTYTITVKGNTFTGPAAVTVTDPTGNVVFTGSATFFAFRLGFAPKGFPG